jgi:hypothetical protein
MRQPKRKETIFRQFFTFLKPKIAFFLERCIYCTVVTRTIVLFQQIPILSSVEKLANLRSFPSSGQCSKLCIIPLFT